MPTLKPTLLLIDDLALVRLQFRDILRNDFTIIEAGSSSEALSVLNQHYVDLVVLDLMMPDVVGLTLFESIRSRFPSLPILIATASDDPKSVLNCLKSGAKDYLFKEDLSTEPRKLLETVHRVLLNQQQRAVADCCLDKLNDTSIFLPSIAPYTACFNTAVQAVKGDFSLVILGETGVGKGTLVHYIHSQLMPKKPLVTVNCGAICPSLAEAELFGSEQGAFTGSTQLRKGKLELAHGGILFLDEITNLSYELQSKLLCALESKKITRLGGSQEISTQFVLICATNRNLEKDVQDGKFRTDLYYRIQQFSLKLPPLREHPKLIRAFVEYYLGVFNKKYKSSVVLSEKNYQDFFKNPWIGNIRELKNELQKLVWLQSQGNTYQAPESPCVVPHSNLHKDLSSQELRSIRLALDKCGYNIMATARELGLHRSTLQGKLRKFNLYPVKPDIH